MDLLRVVRTLHWKIKIAPQPKMLYWGQLGGFKVTPEQGERAEQITRDFPDSIVGVYDKTITSEELMSDIKAYALLMGWEP